MKKGDNHPCFMLTRIIISLVYVSKKDDHDSSLFHVSTDISCLITKKDDQSSLFHVTKKDNDHPCFMLPIKMIIILISCYK